MVEKLGCRHERGCCEPEGLECECSRRSRKTFKEGKKELERWRRVEISDDSVRKEAVWSFDRLEEQIDLYWRQRAHVNWLQYGDRNTAYFHNACSARRRRNRIGNLEKEDGGWVMEEEEKKGFIANYFSTLFRSSVNDDGERSSFLLQCNPLLAQG